MHFQKPGRASILAPASNDPFFCQLLELAQSERTRAKWVFVPYATLKWTLAERLIQARRSWANFRFATPFEVALEGAAPSLLARGVHPKPEALGPSLVHKLLLELPEESAFRPLLSQPGTAEALWSTLKEVRMAGLTSQDLDLPLLRAYEEYIARHQLADRAVVFQEPSMYCPVQPDDLILEFPSVVWSPLERHFLNRLPGERSCPRAPDLPLPRRLQGLPREGTTPSGKLTVAELSLFRAGRRDAEIVEVLRRIRGVPLDQVEIALADPDALALLRDKLAACDLPATFEEGLPIGLSRPGQAVLGILSWVEHRYSAFDLRQLLLADLLTIGSSRLDSSFAAHYLERARATWERETYSRNLGSLKAWLLERLSRAEEPRLQESLAYQVDMIDLLLEWIEGLLNSLPVHHDEVDWSAWVRGLQRILEQHVPGEESARLRLLRALEELLLLEGQRWPVEETVRLLREKLQVLTYGASRALPGHLHVTLPERLGLSGRRELFLLGLEEGRLRLDPVEDPVLSDRERRALHPALARSEDRPAETRFALFERLACADGRLTVSYSTRDMHTGQEQLPTWLFFQAARQLRPLESFEQLEEWLGEPAVYAAEEPSRSAGEAEWWLARRPTDVLAHFPWLAAGAEAVRERLSERFTCFDGHAPSAAGRLDPRQTGEPTSASRLETLASCPFKYFLEVGLKIRPPALDRPDPDRWLDEAARGKLLHEVFALYHRRLRAQRLRPDVDRDGEVLEELLEEQLVSRRRLLPPPSEAIAHNETLALRRDLDRFLRLEALSPEREPHGLEVGFGLPELFDEPLARLEPVEIDLGEGMRFRLRGRIDRLDRLEGGYEVVDYKTGRRLAKEKGAVYRGGRQLQHALYALAAEDLVGGSVLGSCYYFPVSQAERARVALPFPDRERLRQLLKDLMEPLETGAFVHTDRLEDDCQYCELSAACRSRTEPVPKAMLEDPLLGFRRRCGEAR